MVNPRLMSYDIEIGATIVTNFWGKKFSKITGVDETDSTVPSMRTEPGWCKQSVEEMYSSIPGYWPTYLKIMYTGTIPRESLRRSYI